MNDEDHFEYVEDFTCPYCGVQMTEEDFEACDDQGMDPICFECLVSI